jgi:hypothetical protein
MCVGEVLILACILIVSIQRRDEKPQADAGGRGPVFAAAIVLGVPGDGGGRPGEQQPPAAPDLPSDWADLRPPRAPLHLRRLDDRPRHP